jgi:hypothetical protein
MHKAVAVNLCGKNLHSTHCTYALQLQSLQQEVRKINDIAYSIESLAIDAEKRVEFLGSEVKKVCPD